MKRRLDRFNRLSWTARHLRELPIDPPPAPVPEPRVEPTELHTYQCSFCKTVATSTVRTGQTRCNLCGQWMRYGWSEPIRTEAQRALAKRGLVYNPYVQQEQK